MNDGDEGVRLDKWALSWERTSRLIDPIFSANE
jgi:hypothetical protein